MMMAANSNEVVAAITADRQSLINESGDDDDHRNGDDEDDESLGIRTRQYNLRVMSPKTRTKMGQEYTAYCVSLQTTSTTFRLSRSRTWRRFSEFVWLRKELDKIDNWRNPAVLPSKRFWNVLDPKFVEGRRLQLEQWLHKVLSEPLYLSSAALHLFLQTEMTLENIEEYLDGNFSEARMEEIWHNQGKLFHYQPHNLLHNSFRQEPTEIHCSVDVHAYQQEESNASQYHD